jgi:argininosuccinate lyase
MQNRRINCFGFDIGIGDKDIAMSKLWGGRFSGELDALMKQFNDSMPFDQRMWEADIAGSIAYAKAIARSGIISAKERDALVKGLEAVFDEFAAGSFEIKPGDEDIHTAVERRLREISGPVAGKLHTGRSRNDQVATDYRMYCHMAVARLQAGLKQTQQALLDQAAAHVKTVMPGYTHLQRAQPVTFGHWCLAYVWQLQRDVERLNDALKRIDISPLGAGALAGNPFWLDRETLARDLGFAGVTQNSLDAVSDRDFAAELLFCCALVGVHLSRLGEDLVIYSTAEFGFVTLADAYSTGSSLMPQKKNADSMELARGKSGRLIGNLVTLLTVLKGLPLSYDKDMQEDKESLFDSLDTLELTLAVCAGAVATLKVNPEKMRAALDPAMLATDVAEYLVRKGVPFREAHHHAGAAVALAEKRGVPLSTLPLDAWRGISPAFKADIAKVFNFEQSVESRDVTGGTSARAIKAQIAAAKRAIKTS